MIGFPTWIHVGAVGLAGLLTATGLAVGLLAATGVLFGTQHASGFPAPAPVPLVIGLTEQQARAKIEAAHLVPVVLFTRAGRESGRVVLESMSNLLHVPGHSFRISLEGTPVVLRVTR